MKFRFECIVLFVVQPTKSKILQIYRTIYMRLYMFRCEKLQYSSKWPKKYKKDTDKIYPLNRERTNIGSLLLPFNRSRSRSLTELTRLIIPPTKIVLVPTWVLRCTIWTWILTSPMHTMFYCPTEIRSSFLRKAQVYNFV